MTGQEVLERIVIERNFLASKAARLEQLADRYGDYEPYKEAENLSRIVRAIDRIIEGIKIDMNNERNGEPIYAAV
jgi:shikimate 5-dehydrogenase